MVSISVEETQYIPNFNCSYCGSVHIKYKSKEDTTLMKDTYPFLCTICHSKMKRDLSTEFYEKI